MNFMNLRMMKLKNKRLEKIETLQNYLKEIDNGWNSGQVFEIETILGELIEEYNEVHNTRVETEIKCSDQESNQNQNASIRNPNLSSQGLTNSYQSWTKQTERTGKRDPVTSLKESTRKKSRLGQDGKMGGENYTPQHDIDYAVLDKMDKDIILDYVWEHMDMMDKIRQWIKDVYD